MKNDENFILKALFVLKIFNFCLRLLIVQKKGLGRKDKINFKIYDVTT